MAIQARRESAATLRVITQSSSEFVFKCETTSEFRIESGPDPSLGRSLVLHRPTGPDPGLGEGQSRTTYQGQNMQVVFKVKVDPIVKVKVNNKVRVKVRVKINVNVLVEVTVNVEISRR